MADTSKEKSPLLSKGLWGSVISVLPTVLGLFGVTLAPGFDEAINTLISASITMGGAALAFWGRLVAVKKLVVK